jgi:hypothetical protein
MSNCPDDCQKGNVINVKLIPCRDIVNFPDVKFMAFSSFTPNRMESELLIVSEKLIVHVNKRIGLY